ncbi:MAG: hypothetical protein LBH04_06310 [Tannerellaceae bacterium]|jgi:hypothetical protein|nr:hypothetical protein [Tannerellaceae bacterium]
MPLRRAKHYLSELYGFKLLVKTEETIKEGLFLKEKRFFIEGEGHVKYSYNNGRLANDPKLAVNFFLHAMEKIPLLIEKHERENVKLFQDLPVLQEVIQSTWRKEEELKALKSELSALNRKIDLSLKPIDTGEDKPEEKQEHTTLIPFTFLAVSKNTRMQFIILLNIRDLLFGSHIDGYVINIQF